MSASILPNMGSRCINMKKVEALIRAEKLDEVRVALEEKGFIGMTLTEVKGRGTQKGILLEWRAGEYRIEFLPKLKLELIVNDADVDSAIDAITVAARTGKAGDGKIFVSPIEEVVRIRTGERGSSVV